MEFTCGTDAGSLWQKLCDSACFQQWCMNIWSKFIEYLEVMMSSIGSSILAVENFFSPVFWVFHTAFALYLMPDCSCKATVRTLRTCLCCHLLVCSCQGLHRAGPTIHVHCKCWMMLNDSEYLLLNDWISIYFYYLYVYIVCTLYTMWIMCIKFR